MNEPKNSLIIGNGFDIDLGLNTRFSDFANAKDFWPENDGSKLSAYLESKKSVEKWFNLDDSAPYNFLVKPVENEWNGVRSIEARLVDIL